MALFVALTPPICVMSPWGRIMLSGPRWRVGLHGMRGYGGRWGRERT